MAGLTMDGWEYYDIFCLFIDHDAFKLIEKNEIQFSNWLKRKYKSFQVKKLEGNGKIINEAYYTAQVIGWHNVNRADNTSRLRGETIQRVVLAILAITYKKHEYVNLNAVPISYSEIRQYSGTGYGQISKVISYLKKNTQITQVKPGTILNSTIYNITNLVDYLGLRFEEIDINLDIRISNPFETELWIEMGGYARKVFNCFGRYPMSTAKIIETTGLSRKTVNNNLNRLINYGLVSKVGHGKYERTGTEPATIVERDKNLRESMNKRIRGIDNLRNSRQQTLVS